MTPMGFNQLLSPLLLLQMVIVLMLSCTPTLTSQTFPIAKSGCQDRCGNVSIPFPFGTIEGCYLNEAFFINCTNSSQPLLRKSTIDVTDISLDGQLRVMQNVAYDCYDQNGTSSDYFDTWISLADPFTFNSTANKFTAVGCDTYAIVQGLKADRNLTLNYTTGCISLCDSKIDVLEGSCSGIGCCQTSISSGTWNISVTLSSYSEHRFVRDFNNCSYAFVVDDKAFKFSADNLTNLSYDMRVPVVVDWAIDYETCDAAQKNMTSYACTENAECYVPVNGMGYRCSCKVGYQGNPYLPGGCQDIDECEDPNIHRCTKNSACNNTLGNYTCPCLKGYHGDGKEGGDGCTSDQNGKIRWYIIVSGASASVGVLFLMVFTFILYKVVKKRRNRKRKEKFFKRNGGLLLQRQLSADEGAVEKTMVFSAKELNKASDGFNENRILGQGGQGTVYKGMLTDGRIIAIKKSETVNESQLEQFINEVVILSQVKHRNVVKLLGCCLETEVPLLVYEFITNGTLFSLIHNENDDELPLTWNLRLRIATEVAGALAYLHSAISVPIFHRDVKSSNILLDEKYIAKIADFGTSMSVAIDKTHLTTLVKGTFGYLDPEYFQSSQFTEKSDVYSFGVVLVELLTRQKPISSGAGEDGNLSLATRFLRSMDQNSLKKIVDPQVLDLSNEKEVTAVAELAEECLNLNGKKRPTMKEVATRLESIKMSSVHSTAKENFQSPSFIEGDSSVFSDTNYSWTTESKSFTSASAVHPLLFNAV